MSGTIDDFKNYFKPDKEMTRFNVHDAVVNTISLLEGSMQNSKVAIEINAKDKPVINGYRNEYSQVILNILTNANDAFMECRIDNPRILITISGGDGQAVVTIADNAGGIPEEIIENIFDPYFTTKGAQQGTGIGLYMSKTIIEKNMWGSLTVRNVDGGAEFRIEVGNASHV
jgi:C4-dicarboxylate-specific signal transduction histidine kinase